LSDQNEIRKLAEDKLEEFRQGDPNVFIQRLIEILSNREINLGVKNLSIVTLRQHLVKESTSGKS